MFYRAAYSIKAVSFTFDFMVLCHPAIPSPNERRPKLIASLLSDLEPPFIEQYSFQNDRTGKPTSQTLHRRPQWHKYGERSDKSLAHQRLSQSRAQSTTVNWSATPKKLLIPWLRDMPNSVVQKRIFSISLHKNKEVQHGHAYKRVRYWSYSLTCILTVMDLQPSAGDTAAVPDDIPFSIIHLLPHITGTL